MCCLGAYREVTWEIVHAILESGLYDRSVSIEVGVLGTEAEQQVVETLIGPFERFRIAYRSSDVLEYEFPTLGLLQDACVTWDGPVYYLHTKGVSARATRGVAGDLRARYWRRLMLDAVVANHPRCLAELTVADTVGTLWKPRTLHPEHYAGNFWWARPSHIRGLPDIRGLQHPRQRFLDGPLGDRIPCEFWLTMAAGRFAHFGYPGDDLVPRGLWRWTISVENIVNDLLIACGGRHFAELGNDGAGSYIVTVKADSNVSVSCGPAIDRLSEEQFLAATPPEGGYSVLSVDARYDEMKRCIDVIERCLPKLTDDGVLVVHHSNPPFPWHQRPAEDVEPRSDWTGQAWRAVIEFRIRHPQYEVFTVDTDWGCTVVWPSRRARRGAGVGSVDALAWPAFAHQRDTLLNLVDVAWFRRYLYACPYLAGSARLVSRTELLNVLIAVNGLDSYLEIGVGTVENQEQIIAPIRQSVDPGAVDGGTATYPMTSDDFFASGFGLDRYDLIVVDGLREAEQCLRDLENALARVSDPGWIVAHDANPPTGNGWKALVRFRSDHPELEFFTLDFDGGCAVMRRRAGMIGTDAVIDLPDILEAHDSSGQRSRLLNLVPASAEELRRLFCNEQTQWDTSAPVDVKHPGDAQAIFHRAQSYFDLGDFANARDSYARRAEMGGGDEEVYLARYRIAESMDALGSPWPDVQDAYLAAWEFRPVRAEPLYAVAHRYRVEQRYRLGYLFAKRAAEIPLPKGDSLFVCDDVYGWRAIDEQALCASWIDRHAEAFRLFRDLVARPDVPDDHRQRIAGNRDVCAQTMIDAASSYPHAAVRSLVAGARESEVTVSLVAGSDRAAIELTLNSFLHCCTDVSRVGRFLLFDAGLSAEDRAMLRDSYGFLEFGPFEPGAGCGDGPGPRLAQVRAQIHGRFWLHLGAGWKFFAPERFISRLTAVLEAEPEVVQVGINVTDSVTLIGSCAAEDAVRRAPDTGRYVLADAASSGPAMFDTERWAQAAAGSARLRTATLDEVLCVLSQSV